MSDKFSSQRSTNILLVVLIIAMLALIVRLEMRLTGMQNSLRWIGNNTSEIGYDVGVINENTKYLQYQ